MKFKELPTQQELKELFNYDQNTGLFTWKVSPARAVKAGSKAGGKDWQGYIRLNIKNQKYFVQRLAWVYVNGSIPEGMEIDHINEDKSDNRLCNLRLATPSKNRANKKKIKGFYYHKGSGKWNARININKKQHHIGSFDCPLMARLAYEDAAKQIHGVFAAV